MVSKKSTEHVSIWNSYEIEVENLILTSGKDRLLENTLGLVGEAGEFAEKVKKKIRLGALDSPIGIGERVELLKELGDVLFYLTALSNYLDSDLKEIMDININKLHDRKKRNKLQGSGDNR